MTAPDSAYAILESISETGENREFSARLKLAKADCIYYSDVLSAENDSDLTSAIDYFEYRNDKSRLARAYFLRANQRAQAYKYGEAMVDFLYGEKWAARAKDSVSLGLIYRGMAETYDMINDKASAVVYMKKSYDIFKALQSKRYLGWIMYDYARMLNNALRHDDAIKILDESYLQAILEEDDFLRNSCILFYGQLYGFLNDHQRAVEYFERYDIDNSYDDAKRLYWAFYGGSLVELGRLDEASSLQDSLTKYFPQEYYLKLRLASRRGRATDIVPLLGVALDDQNDDLRTVYHRQFTDIVEGYYKQQQIAASAREERDRAVILAILVVALLLSLVIVLEVRRRRSERRNSMAVLRMIEETLKIREDEHRAFEESTAQQIKLMRERLMDMVKERTLQANELYQDIADIPKSKREQKICNRLQRALREFAPGTEYLKSLEATLDEAREGIVARFRNDYPDMKEPEVAMFIYQVLEVPTQVCAVMMNVAPATVYSRKTRLRSHIQSRPSVADIYLKFFR